MLAADAGFETYMSSHVALSDDRLILISTTTTSTHTNTSLKRQENLEHSFTLPLPDPPSQTRWVAAPALSQTRAATSTRP